MKKNETTKTTTIVLITNGKKVTIRECYTNDVEQLYFDYGRNNSIYEYSNIQKLKDDLYNNVILKLDNTSKSELLNLINSGVGTDCIVEYNIEYNVFNPYTKYDTSYLNRVSEVLSEEHKKEVYKVTCKNEYEKMSTLELHELYKLGDSSNELLIELATRCAYSVLKQLINKVYDSTLVSVRRDVTHAKHNINNIERLSSDVYSLGYNEDGDLIRVVNNERERENFEKIIQENLGVGIDLVNSAICEIIEKTNKYGRDLFKVFEERRLKRCVYMKREDSVKGWETVEFTPLQEVYRELRREIDKNGGLKIAGHRYTYIEDMSTDLESGEECVYFKKLGLYADLGGYAHDFNGSFTEYTVEVETVETIENIIEKMKLSDRQSRVLQLRLKGYGYKAIGTYLGVDPKNVKRTCKQIADKVIKNNLISLDSLESIIETDKNARDRVVESWKEKCERQHETEKRQHETEKRQREEKREERREKHYVEYGDTIMKCHKKISTEKSMKEKSLSQLDYMIEKLNNINNRLLRRGKYVEGDYRLVTESQERLYRLDREKLYIDLFM